MCVYPFGGLLRQDVVVVFLYGAGTRGGFEPFRGVGIFNPDPHKKEFVMASFTCPKCNITLKKGSWELVEQCPDCATPWVSDEGVPKRSLRRVQVMAGIFAVLSFVPYLGLVFGILGVFWSYLAVKVRHVALGIVLMIVSTLVGLVGQGALVYHEVGVFEDHNCQQRLGWLGESIQEYRAKNGHYPESLDVLEKGKFRTPKQCFAGGKYFYLPPWGWKVAGPGPTATAPSVLGVDVLQAMTQQASSAPAMKAPMPSEPTVPEAWAEGIPKEYQAALYGATLDVVQLPPVKAITEPTNPSRVVMAAEVFPSHRYVRICLMADSTVRTMSAEDYEKLLSRPENAVFARVLEGARKAEWDQKIGKNAKKLADERAKRKKAAEASTAAAATAASKPAVEASHGAEH
jgi:hypothetical protein